MQARDVAVEKRYSVITERGEEFTVEAFTYPKNAFALYKELLDKGNAGINVGHIIYLFGRARESIMAHVFTEYA